MSAFERLSERIQGTAAWRWYAGREPHEKPVIAALGLLVVGALFWVAVWKPVSDWRINETNRYRNALATWEWMQANEKRARAVASRTASEPARDRSLLPLVTREANSVGLRLSRLQPEGDGSVSVVIQAQPFNTVIQWLDRLQRTHDVEVQRIAVDAEGQPGLVNAQIRLN